MGSERVGLRELKKQQTRRELADAALRLFSERGYATTSVADIAAAAGVSTRTFFAYFPSKDDALFADTDERLALMHGLLRDLPAGTAPIRAFREIVQRIFTAAASRRAAMTRAIDQLERGLGQVGAGSDGAGSAQQRLAGGA